MLDVDDERAKAIAPSLDNIFGILGEQARLVSPILSGPPKTPEEMREWYYAYGRLVVRLSDRLIELEEYVSVNFE